MCEWFSSSSSSTYKVVLALVVRSAERNVSLPFRNSFGKSRHLFVRGRIGNYRRVTITISLIWAKFLGWGALCFITSHMQSGGYCAYFISVVLWFLLPVLSACGLLILIWKMVPYGSCQVKAFNMPTVIGAYAHVHWNYIIFENNNNNFSLAETVKINQVAWALYLKVNNTGFCVPILYM